MSVTLVRRKAVVVVLCALLLAGCSGGRINLVSHPAPSQSRSFSEDFGDGYYGQSHKGPYNNLIISLRNRTPRRDDPLRITRQTLIMEMFWLPQSTVTAGDPSLSNCQITWLIETDGRTIGYQGTGFVSVEMKWEKGVPVGPIKGWVEAAHLKMNRGDKENDIFGMLEITGTFTAQYNPEEARHLANTVEQILGPSPSIERLPPRPRITGG